MGNDNYLFRAHENLFYIYLTIVIVLMCWHFRCVQIPNVVIEYSSQFLRWNFCLKNLLFENFFVFWKIRCTQLRRTLTIKCVLIIWSSNKYGMIGIIQPVQQNYTIFSIVCLDKYAQVCKATCLPILFWYIQSLYRPIYDHLVWRWNFLCAIYFMFELLNNLLFFFILSRLFIYIEKCRIAWNTCVIMAIV